MAYRVVYALEPDRARAAENVGVLLGLLTAIDTVYLQSAKRAPGLAEALSRGLVKATKAPSGQEEWQDVPTALASGCVDAEDAACWRAAEASLRTRQAFAPKLTGGSPEEAKTGRYAFALGLFGPGSDRALSRHVLGLMLDALYQIDLLYLRDHPNTPSVYEAPVTYMEEPIGQEEWQDIPTSIAMGISDCEDLACWRAAELTAKGIPARPIFQEFKRPNGSYLYHIVTKRSDGTLEDPSRILGMR